MNIHLLHHLKGYPVIVDGYDIPVQRGASGMALHIRQGCLFDDMYGYFCDKTASFPFLALHADIAAEHSHDMAHDGEAQTETVLRGGIRKPLERSEHPLLLLVGHARTRIFHCQCQHPVPILCQQ